MPLPDPDLIVEKIRTAVSADMTLHRDEEIEVLWAPFDHVNRNAGLAIVGVTPGPTQMSLSHAALKKALHENRDPEADLAAIKAGSSFRGGTMEVNLKSLLEHAGIAEAAGIEDVDQLWTGESDKVHFTSALRYPTFFKGAPYNHDIDPLKHPFLREMVETLLAAELAALPRDAVIVALGSKNPRIVRHAASLAGIDPERVRSICHPSPSSNGAVRNFLSGTRRRSRRPCRCFFCDDSRLPDGWTLRPEQLSRHDALHQ